MSDRLEEIKRDRARGSKIGESQIRWLIAEVERLRKENAELQALADLEHNARRLG